MRRALAVLVLAALAGCGTTVPSQGGQAVSNQPGFVRDPTRTAPTAAAELARKGSARHPAEVVGRPPHGVTPAVRGDVPRPAKGAPVVVGIRLPNASAGAVVGNLTGTELDMGNPRAMAAALVAWINAHGGIAGRRVTPFYYENCPPLSCDLTVQDQRVCSTFTQDHKAIAVVDATETSVALASCLARVGTATLGGGAAAFDTRDFQSARGLWSPYLLPTDVAYDRLVHRLEAMRWFVAGEKVGLLVVDTPTFRRTAAVTKRAMAAVGRSFAHEAYWSSGGNDMSGIVLQFKSRDIRRLVIVEAGSAALLQFGPAAGAQQYYPKVTVTSADVMGTLALIASPRTLEGAAGIGWLPAADAPPNPPKATKTAELCARIYREAQVSTAGPLAAAFAGAYCDGLLFAKTAYDRAADVSLGALSAAVAELGTAYVPASTFTTRFLPGRFAGTASTRDVRYDTSCTCFRYVSGPFAVP